MYEYCIIGYTKHHICEYFCKHCRLVLEIIDILHNIQWKIAKMAFCTFLISKTMNTIDMELIILEDTYVHCALGYIKIYLF